MIKILSSRYYFSIAIFLLISNLASAQERSVIHLQDAIALSKERSPASWKAKTKNENSFWVYRSYRAALNPRLVMSGTLVDFNRDFYKVLQPDGDIRFQPVANNFSNVNLQLSQPISLTGTEIFASSLINRFDNFDLGTNSYSTNPVVIGLRHSFFTFKPMMWDREIEPLKYEESKKEYIAELENIAIETTKVYFDLFDAYTDYQLAATNLANADTLLLIGEKRYASGSIYKNELLRLQLLKKTSQKALSQAHLDVEIASLKFNAYLGIPEQTRQILSIPSKIPFFVVDEETALHEATVNRHEVLSFERRKYEAERDLARAKGDNGLSVDFYATFGLANQGNNVSNIYEQSTNQERISVGFSIPILDWGRSKAKIQTALANQKMATYSIEQDHINFRQQILSLVRQFSTIKEQLQIALESYQIGLESYDISKKRYLSNSLDLTELNLALNQKDQAQKDYIQSLRSYWTAYFQLRYLTLYDFENNARLTHLD